MKLRMGRNSIRVRVLRSEVDLLRTGNRLEETVRFGAEADSQLTYAIAGSAELREVSVHFTGQEIAVLVPEDRLQAWAASEEVGIAQRIDTGNGSMLDVLIEKDFACLDRSEAENVDTFENPKRGVTC